MNVKAIESRAKTAARNAAERGAQHIEHKVAEMLGFVETPYYADHPFRVAFRPLKAYIEKHLTDKVMGEFQERAEAAALAALREDLKAVERGDMTTKGLKP